MLLLNEKEIKSVSGGNYFCGCNGGGGDVVGTMFGCKIMCCIYVNDTGGGITPTEVIIGVVGGFAMATAVKTVLSDEDARYLGSIAILLSLSILAAPIFRRFYQNVVFQTQN